MALDFHLSKNQKDMPYMYSSASFVENVHEHLSYRMGLPDSEFPLFRRMEDYYKDVSYGHEEIKLLINEIYEIRKHFIESKAVLEQLNSTEGICKEALEKHLGILVYYD